MRLIYQKQILSLCAFRKETLQLCTRIKNIIIITDHRIRPQRHIQSELKRTNLPFLCLRLDRRTVKPLPLRDQLKYGVIDAVKMPLCIRTRIGIALRLIEKTDFFFGSQCQCFHAQSLTAQDLIRLLRYRSCHCLCRSIENAVCQSLSHRFYRRKYRGKCFSRSGRSLYKQRLFAKHRPIDRGRHFLLSVPPRIRKFQPRNRGLPHFLPFDLKLRPLLILLHDFPEPFPQLICRKYLLETADLFCLDIAVRHLHADMFQTVLLCINARIAFCLRKMERIRLGEQPDIPIKTFDLVNENNLLRRRHLRFPCRLKQRHLGIPPCALPLRHIGKNPVRAAVHRQNILFCFYIYGKRHLCAVISAHSALNLPMNAASLLHCLFFSKTSPAIVNVAGAQDKFYQISHGNTQLRLRYGGILTLRTVLCLRIHFPLLCLRGCCHLLRPDICLCGYSLLLRMCIFLIYSVLPVFLHFPAL